MSSETPPSVAIYYSDLFLAHDTGKGHPERPDRLTSILTALQKAPFYKQLSWPEFPSATPEQISLIHPDSYQKIVHENILSGKNQLQTGDTKISPQTEIAAYKAAGAGISACDDIIAGKFKKTFCLVRPPGHHATQDRGMGFCVFNNIAIAARHLQKKHGLKKILIIDFDVHHGNGTQDIFYHDPTVFYFSVHQKGIYPGSGHEHETGEGAGKGFTRNIELDRHSGDDQALKAFQEHLVPEMKRFKPDFILVSAGFDAHENDPLGGLSYTAKGYGHLAREINQLANTYTQGKTIYMLEGGYGLEGISASVVEILNVLLEN